MKSTHKTKNLPPVSSKNETKKESLFVVYTYKEILWLEHCLYMLDGVTPTLDKQYVTVLTVL